eukprot:scaffold14074_cov111-Isochrysis_galbana.AAC.4
MAAWRRLSRYASPSKPEHPIPKGGARLGVPSPAEGADNTAPLPTETAAGSDEAKLLPRVATTESDMAKLFSTGTAG